MLVTNISSLPLSVQEPLEMPGHGKARPADAGPGIPVQTAPLPRPGAGMTTEEAGQALDSARDLLARGAGGLMSVHQIDQSRLAALLDD